MMENGSLRYDILRIEGLRIARYFTYPVFVLLFLAYVFILISNLCIIVVITVEKALHKPMFLLFCNLPVNDVLIATVVLPALLKDILTESEKYISYIACVIQAFGFHLFNTNAHTILIIMAFDRYLAICEPLRYHTIMTYKMVVSLSVIAWTVSIFPVWALLALSIRLSHCTSIISNPFCDNASLFKLSCEDVSVNQIFGLFTSIVTWIISLSCMGFTYLKIAYVCLKNQNSTLKNKAMKTCSTHLIVYLILTGCGCSFVILHRFSAYVELRNLASIIIFVIPASLNPVVYGLQTKELRQALEQMFLRRKVIPG